MANADGSPEREAHVVGDIGGLGQAPRVAIVLLVHALHVPRLEGFGIGTGRWQLEHNILVIHR